jgi:eukaryotic-like serine/threonine-protein kinase
MCAAVPCEVLGPDVPFENSGAPAVASEAERYHLGSIIAGRYCVERPIGAGAMGTVALARHVSLGEDVAIKFLDPELRRDPVAIARLSREARALARIKSDHVTRVLDVGATLATGPYMVMEYLEGTDLGEVLEAEGPLPVERVIEITMQLCEALTVAHTAGIVHHDIKPQNLFLARHGQFETLKVLDFGISEVAPSGGEGAVPPGHRAEDAAASSYGTPSYMSPERVRNGPEVDHRSDIWSVGVVLHELVTGRGVFDAPTVAETCARVVSDAPLELEANEAVLPPSLRRIIERCLERDPSQRYQSVEELAAALVPLGSMTERFRGRSIGALSGKHVEEQLASTRARRSQPTLPRQAISSPGSAPEMPQSPSTGAGRDGPAQVSYGSPRLRARKRRAWQYGAIALAGALLCLVMVSAGGEARGGPAPSIVVHTERLEPGDKFAVRGLDEHAPAPREESALPRGVPAETNPTAAAMSLPPIDGQLSAEPATVAPDNAAALAAAALENAEASPHPRDQKRAKAKRKAARRKRAAAELRLALDEIPTEAATPPRPRVRRAAARRRSHQKEPLPRRLEEVRSAPVVPDSP